MSGKQYWKNKIPYVTGNFLAMAVLAVFLLLGGNTRDSVLFILGSWLVILAVSMGAAYMCRRKQMDTLLESVNQLGIGPQGFGGLTTALSVHIKAYPTHIAGLSVAVNVGCHVTRHATATL